MGHEVSDDFDLDESELIVINPMKDRCVYWKKKTRFVGSKVTSANIPHLHRNRLPKIALFMMMTFKIATHLRFFPYHQHRYSLLSLPFYINVGINVSIIFPPFTILDILPLFNPAVLSCY